MHTPSVSGNVGASFRQTNRYCFRRNHRYNSMRRSGAHSGKSRCRSAESFDVGVAGIHRLFANDTKLRDCDVLIVAAGMEGALPSVIAGLYPQPIIALPTSVGYGTALSGFTALFAMLTSCAPGVSVVNIDNGVGAAAAAFKIISIKVSSNK